MLIYKNYIT